MKAKDKLTATIDQVAFLTGETKRTAEAMMLKVTSKKTVAAEFGFNPQLRVDVDEFERVHGIRLRLAIEDLRDNALKRSSFKKYLFRQIPEEKLGAKFKDHKTPSKTIRLPSVLRSLLTEETLREVQAFWDNNYAGKVYEFYKDKDEKSFSPDFRV